jgi:hypothetical protein
MEDFKTISLTSTKKKVKVNNPTHYPLIGKGKQGAVFKLSSKRCVKIYSMQEHWEREYNAYKVMQGSHIIPKEWKESMGEYFK